jgi:hypothetical protein
MSIFAHGSVTSPSCSGKSVSRYGLPSLRIAASIRAGSVSRMRSCGFTIWAVQPQAAKLAAMSAPMVPPPMMAMVSPVWGIS